MTELLRAINVTKVFSQGGLLKRDSETVAVDDVSLVIGGDEPRITAIAGESGSGKTTLVRILLGMCQPSRGSVTYLGKELQEMSRPEKETFRKEIQVIFQDPFEVYNPFYRVDHVLTTPLQNFKLASSKVEASAMIEAALELVGLRPDETLGRYPHDLSGGQRQRVMVARAFLLKPRIILADEPVSMVDASLRATILESLLKLKNEAGISLVYITHDLTTAYQVCDNIMVLYQGSTMEVGDVEKVIRDPAHPYTRLLVGSIPLPNPDIKWSDEGLRIRDRKRMTGGCKFANRCPYLMPQCNETQPPFYKVDDHHAAACHLYMESPTINSLEAMR